MTYSEKLKDPRWQKKRLNILNRDNFTCLVCKDDKLTLHVHHLRYVTGKDPWDYEDYDLATFCGYCHDIWHYLYDSGYAPEIISAVADFYDKSECDDVNRAMERKNAADGRQ